MSAADTHRDLFLDRRGDLVRASWHRDERTVVLSLWRDGECRATTPIDVATAARLSAFLLGTVADAAT
jgi:hypothetical protein